MPSINSAQTIHDIRNALNVIMTSGQLLRGPDPLTAKQQKYVKRILDASQQLLAIIDERPVEIAKTEDASLKVNVSVVKEESPCNDAENGTVAGEEKILFVDDDPETLESYKQLLLPEFLIETAVGGEDGLAAIQARGPYSIVVSDMKMPGMSGIEFLARVRAVTPDTVRMMLTGNLDVNVAIEAVNQDHIFRFLTKPCDRESLRSSLATGLVRYRLVVAEKEILENTLMGGIKVLTDVLSAVSPEAFGRSLRIAHYVRHIISKVQIATPWQLEAAAMLSQLGCITLDSELLRAAYSGTPLSPENRARFEAHPTAARDLLTSVPRLEAVAWMIGQQLAPQIPQDPPYVAGLCAEAIIGGAKMLKLAVAFDGLKMQALSNEQAIAQLRNRSVEFEREFLDALTSLKLQGSKMISRKISVTKLIPGMILEQEIKTANGLLIVTKGQEVTRPLVARLMNFSEAGMIEEGVLALVPVHFPS